MAVQTSLPFPEPGDPPSLGELRGQLPTYINCREADVVETLYRPCLGRARRYVRGAGYFRSSVFRLMTEDLLSFCIAGGRMSLVTSTQMDLRDFDGAVRAYEAEGFYEDLRALLEAPETVDPVRMLCALICNQKLDIWVALMREDIAPLSPPTQRSSLWSMSAIGWALRRSARY